MDRFFGVTAAGSSIRQELLAGISTFLTMSFIVAVNPMFLEAAGIPFAAGFVATVATTAIAHTIMGLWARWPVAVAPGMGLNAYFAYGLVLGQGFSWQQALAAVFVASVLFLLFSLSRLRSWLIGAIPASLRLGITAGIGLFLAMIGLQGMGLVVDDPDTLLRLGNLGESGRTAEPCRAAGDGRAGSARHARRHPVDHPGVEPCRMAYGDCRIWWHCRGTTGRQRGLCAGFLGRDKRRLSVGGLYSVLSGFLRYHRHIDRDRRYCRQETRRWQHRDLDRAVVADTSTSVVGSLLGTSSMTTYLESATGIRAGGRTGLTAMTVAALFLCCLFFEPLFASIPGFAAAPALVFVAAAFWPAWPAGLG